MQDKIQKIKTVVNAIHLTSALQTIYIKSYLFHFPVC